MAVGAAIAALIAGQHANEAMVDQIQAANEWNYYQAKGVKSAVLESKLDLLRELGKAPTELQNEKLKSYHHDQEKISEKAKEFESSSRRHLEVHEKVARSVTLFQVAIALAAVAILSRRRRFLLVSYVLSAVGVLFFVAAHFR